MTAELLTVLAIIFFISCVVFEAISIITENLRFTIGLSISFILLCVCICMPSNAKEPSRLYQKKLKQ